MAGFGGAVKLTGESEYRKALNQITQNLREVSSEMKAVSAAYSSNDKSVEAVAARSAVLNKTLEEQTNKLNVLRAQYEAMTSQYTQQAQKHQALVDAYEKEKAELDRIAQTAGTTSQAYQDQKNKVTDMAQAVKQSTSAQESNEKAMSNMRVAMNNAQADINSTTRSLDELGKEAEESGKEAEKAGSGGWTVFKQVLANLSTQAINAAMNGLKKLGGTLVSVGKQAYSSYASYEQLVGGVETLFGESADIVQEYAARAYKTAGVSANKYMEQATSFSATLLQGLEGDTVKAAQYADMAIIDMSDNANKMGTSLESIQNAYQGFAKKNYTMLENLK